MSRTLCVLLVQLGRRSALHPFTSPPLGLLYLAACLRDRQPVNIRILVQEIERCSDEALVRKILQYSPDIVGISCMTPYAESLAGVTHALRTALPSTSIIIGGPHISAFGQRAFEETAAHAAVLGEGERSFELYASAVQGDTDFSAIPGLLWRDANGQIIANPGQAPMVTDLDTLPMPAYDLIDLSKYWRVQSMPPIPRQKYISLLSSRGCPYGCIWCHNMFGRRFRAHSPERMVEEIRYFQEQYGIDDVEFLDDCFNLDRNRLSRFSNLLLRNGGPIKLAFPNALRADILDETAMDALVAAGLYFTCLALESGSPRIQTMTHKRLDIDKFLHAVELAESRRVFTQGFMMLGFPSETADEMEQTIRTASDSRLHVGSFFSVTPYPGTPMYEIFRASQTEAGEPPLHLVSDFFDTRVNMTAVSSETLFAYHRKAMRDFYLRPDRIFRIMRDFPQKHLLYRYVPLFLTRLTRGLFR